MKVIVSHDVDHLFGRDHWFRDLIYPKLWVRSFLQGLKGEISWRECWLRSASCFQRDRHRIPLVMEFDRQHGVPATYFFGMNQGLGMSYYPSEAREVIRLVHEKGFPVGVHGVCYDDPDGIRREYETFRDLMGFEPCGIRMHYVRYDENTFAWEAQAGYRFDSTEFDKAANGTIKAPYRVGNMWEFPLCVMDGYLTQSLEEAKRETLARFEECRRNGMEYITILFHEYQFDQAYSAIRDWYVWLIESIEKSEEDSFISFEDAIRELEEKP